VTVILASNSGGEDLRYDIHGHGKVRIDRSVDSMMGESHYLKSPLKKGRRRRCGGCPTKVAR